MKQIEDKVLIATCEERKDRRVGFACYKTTSDGESVYARRCGNIIKVKEMIEEAEENW
jgi:hypothetical protein